MVSKELNYIISEVIMHWNFEVEYTTSTILSFPARVIIAYRDVLFYIGKGR